MQPCGYVSGGIYFVGNLCHLTTSVHISLGFNLKDVGLWEKVGTVYFSPTCSVMKYSFHRFFPPM